MCYLHSYEKQGQTTPVIHRDLKSPNLLLAAPPSSAPDAPPIIVKVADFGLSRDKGQTADFQETEKMTGCGSVLWMAPEILLGKTYNEKVDVFSYAMCVLEMVDCNLPWSGTATSAEVPYRVTKPGMRPTKQLRKATPVLKQLIEQCWVHDASQRPSFAGIVTTLRAEKEAISLGGKE